jgi:phosphoglucomutase
MDKNGILAQAREYVAREKDEFFRTQVEELIEKQNFDELNDRFYTDLEFGTGGLRGVIGGGYNRMNPFTVGRATQGLANYIKKDRPAAQASAVIAYDSRNCSDRFALEAAKVLCGNGIKTYLFTSLRPTPELSFAVRFLKATSGIVITASHNPPEYNGYKCYWEDGAQVIAPHDTGIIAEVRSVKEILSISREEALRKELLVMIDKEVDDAFIAMIKKQSLRPDLLKREGHRLKVAYTPLHGTGAIPVDRALSEMGVKVTFVEEQKNPDPKFPTVKFPNPEEASALQMAIDLGKKIKADLVMGTDPDADRIGIVVPDGTEFRLITGNQLGVLLLDYVVTARKELGKMPKTPAFIKTVVTTELQRLIAEDYGCLVADTLTGFKYIGAKIREWESVNDGPSYIFGGEESYGYLVETEVRDKDAVSAATMTAEMTLYHLTQGRSVLDRLNQIYEKYGYFEEAQITKTFKGESGLKTIAALMDKLRAAPPSEMAGQPVVTIKDYREGTTLDRISGKKSKDINLPSSNVLQFILSDGDIISARPSGTEPKIKFYASCRCRAGIPLSQAKESVARKISAVKQELDRLITQ